jgi:hypothetical protein
MLLLCCASDRRCRSFLVYARFHVGRRTYVDTIKFRPVLIVPIAGNGYHTHFFQIAGRIDLHLDDSMDAKGGQMS